MPSETSRSDQPAGAPDTLPGLRPITIRALRLSAVLLAVAMQLPLSACSLPERLIAVPQPLTTKANISDLSGVRFWIKGDPEPLIREAIASFRKEQQFLAQSGHTGPLPPVNFLAISGGGDNGAFGAGLLVGWTEAGNRPEFKLVTGISTGALIAPLAFLGSDYDAELKRAFTTISKKNILKERNLTAALFDDAMADSRPLFELVSSFVTPEVFAKIAEEYGKGRLLFVGTTDLDAEQPVIWNMTAIAASGRPGTLDLFRKILVASASIPSIFPPVMIEVEVDGQKYQEMHVDGGTVAQVFLYPPTLEVAKISAELKVVRERRAYIIRNAQLKPNWTDVERRTLSIAGRAISTLISSQGIGDLYRLYLITQRDGVDYNLAYIGPEFDAPHPDDFDTGYMQQLFDYGYQLARNGYPWQKYPPGYQPRRDLAAR